jgi:type IV pilus assembly protein PilO
MDLGLDKYQAQLDKLGKLPRPVRIALFPIAFTLVMGVYGYAFYLPASEELTAKQEEHLQLQRKLSEVRAVASNEAAVKQEIADLEKKLQQALRQLPDSKELPVLLTDITSLGKSAGLDFKAFRPQSEVKKAFYAEVPIEVEFVGHYHDIAHFFDEVSRLPRIVNIGEIAVAIASENTQDTVLKVSGLATTFRFVEPDPEAEAAADAKGAKGAKGKGGKPGAAPAAKGARKPNAGGAKGGNR